MVGPMVMGLAAYAASFRFAKIRPQALYEFPFPGNVARGAGGGMIVWRGWGIGLVFIAGTVFILFQMAVNAAMGDGYWEGHQPLLSGVRAILAGAVVLLVRLTLLKPRRQVLSDPETGHTYNFELQHDIFWIDILWWSLLIMALGVWQIFSGEAWDTSFPGAHQAPLGERIIFWSLCGAALALTVLALLFRGRDAPDQAYHSPLVLLGMVAGLPLAYALGSTFIFMAIEQGEQLVVIAVAAALAFYVFGTLQAAVYRISWDESAFRVRRLLGGTVEVPWVEVKSITMHSADAFDMKMENARLKRHTISNHLMGIARFVDMLQRQCARPSAGSGGAAAAI